MKNINEILLEQQKYKNTHMTADIMEIKAKLERLLNLCLKHENDIYAALKLDMNKNSSEVYLSEFKLVIHELKWFIKHVNKIHTTHNKSEFGSRLLYRNYETRKAHGNVLIYSTFNYPFQLSLIPLIGAIACNNTVLLKLSEQPVNTNKLIIKIISQAFSIDQCCVIDPNDAPEDLYEILYNLKIDMVFFTGSYRIGRKICENYAKQMIPVVLELGGKSPVIVEPSCNLKLTAKRLVWAKMLNCGQTCVAPDYVIVHKSLLNQFIDLFACEFKLQYPLETSKHDVAKCAPHQIERYKKLIKDLTFYATHKISDDLELSLINNNDFNHPIWKEELFGPLLPIITYETIENIYEIINHNPNPLALYIFSNDKKFVNEIHNNVIAGSTSVNDCTTHLCSPMPFGGVRESGIGQYHAQHSVECFTRIQPLVKCTKLDINSRYAPTSARKFKVLRSFVK